MNRAFLLLGGNMGNRFFSLFSAIRMLKERAGALITSSAIYQSEAWGKRDQPDFLNTAVLIRTALSPAELLSTVKGIERDLGRTDAVKWGPRLIDIDILLFNEEVIEDQDLKIPHPEMHKRRFALIPLCEIAPEARHPQIRKSIRELLSSCEDPLEVSKV